MWCLFVFPFVSDRNSTRRKFSWQWFISTLWWDIVLLGMAVVWVSSQWCFCICKWRRTDTLLQLLLLLFDKKTITSVLSTNSYNCKSLGSPQVRAIYITDPTFKSSNVNNVSHPSWCCENNLLDLFFFNLFFSSPSVMNFVSLFALVCVWCVYVYVCCGLLGGGGGV